uniref:Moesin/ezrin/radixin 1 n=1 Tax=Schistosoma haematobium TaxID=6185 RepID=A0A094ZJU0_SCHHA
MNTESDQNKLLQKFKNLRKEPQKQVDYLTNAINDIEENLIRNKESYKIQMQKIDQLFRANVNDLNEQINQLKNDLEIQSLHLKQIEKWLKATRGWILIRKYLYKQKYRKWKMELLRTHYHIEGAYEAFNKTVFGNEANHPIWKVCTNSLATVQYPTSNNWINEQSWLHYRKQIIESQLSTKSKDEIKCIQHRLRSKITQQILNHYSNRESHENNEDYVDEINELKQQDELTNYPYSINHPLHIHEQQLMNTFNQIKTVQYLNLIELNEKENDLHSLLTHIRNLKFDLDNEYTKYTQMSFNEIDKKKQQLINFSKVLDELEEEETVEFNNLISKARKTNETRIVLKKELKYLRISQNINAMHRFTYFDYSVREQYNLTDEEWEAKVMNCVSSHKNMSKDDAVKEYIRIAQDLEMFGVTFFKIKNEKKTDLWLGIDALGLNIYEYDNQLAPKVTFPWNEIQKLSYSRNKFFVKPVEASGKVLVFYTDSTHTSKLILNLSTGNHKLYAIRRQPDSIEVQQMKVKAKERQTIRDAEREKLRAEQEAREVMEKRLQDMQRLMQENEEAFARTQTVLEQYECKVNELNAQLEEEKSARKQLENLQYYLEEANRKLGLRIAQERDEINAKINEQNQLLQEREEEKRQFEAELARVRAMHEAEMDHFSEQKQESDECELEAVNNVDEDLRQSKQDTDEDHATRLKLLRQDLSSVRNPNKMQAIDIHYEDIVSKGMDKYRTLRAIREGNTKKRVDQFESM